MRLLSASIWILSLTSLVAAQTPAKPAPDPSRHVSYTTTSEVSVSTQVRFTTLLVLPTDEQVMDILCGDRDYWNVGRTDSAPHVVYVKPAKEGARTNITVLTASGGVYSFLVSEISGTGRTADLKVFVEPDDTMRRATHSAPAFVPASAVEQCRTDAERTRRDSQDGLAQFKAAYPATLRFGYRFDHDKAPMRIEAIWHDEHSTYIRTHAAELPTPYEWHDKEATVVPFETRAGLIVIPKVLTDGYVQLGKEKAAFRLVQE
jgi:type IV secretory pathway VirB9-like protein